MQPEMKVKVTWLQAQVPRTEWDKLNQERVKLGYKWSDIILPAVQTYMKDLKAKPAPPATVPAPKTPKTTDKAPTTKGHTPEETASAAASEAAATSPPTSRKHEKPSKATVKEVARKANAGRKSTETVAEKSAAPEEAAKELEAIAGTSLPELATSPEDVVKSSQ